MRLRRIEIDRFRGIKKLLWDVGGDFVCLVGPCDSTKSTILDAVELALSPRWNIPFNDNDFFNADTSSPIVIQVTVGDLPEELKSDAKYGLETRGWSDDGELHDEPEDDDELALTICLQVEPSHEQSWAVVNDRNPDGRSISWKDREKVGCTRLGPYVDRHLSWSRGSILANLTGESDAVGGILAEAGRAARSTLDAASMPKLQQAAEKAQQAGEGLGVAARESFKPHLDVQAASVGIGGLSLHDGDIPVRMAGLGTTRLLAIAMQMVAAKTDGLTLIDEVEHGLEPHRIRHLLRVLRGKEPGEERRHALLTTHSRLVIEELDAGDLRVVRCHDGITEVCPVDPSLQPLFRRSAEALLARKVIVCEGKTELGVCRRLNDWWYETSGKSFGLLGVALLDGQGSSASAAAVSFSGLGYPTIFLGDSDVPLNPDEDGMAEAGVQVLLWDGDVSIEERLAFDLPWPGVAKMVQLAMDDDWGPQSVKDTVAAQLDGIDAKDLPDDAGTWHELEPGEQSVRAAVGKVANNKKWFKRVDRAERVGQVVIDHYDALEGTDLRLTRVSASGGG